MLSFCLPPLHGFLGPHTNKFKFLAQGWLLGEPHTKTTADKHMSSHLGSGTCHRNLARGALSSVQGRLGRQRWRMGLALGASVQKWFNCGQLDPNPNRETLGTRAGQVP